MIKLSDTGQQTKNKRAFVGGYKMNISELIHILTLIMDECGNVPVYTYAEPGMEVEVGQDDIPVIEQPEGSLPLRVIV